MEKDPFTPLPQEMTARMQFGFNLVHLVLGRLDAERTEKTLERSNGYINTVNVRDPDTGESISRYDLTIEGLKIAEQLASPLYVQAIKNQVAERTNTHPEQKALF